MDATYRDKPDVHEEHADLVAALERAKEHLQAGATSATVRPLNEARPEREEDDYEREFIAAWREVAAAMRDIAAAIRERADR